MESLSDVKYLKYYNTKSHTMRDFYLSYMDDVYTNNYMHIHFSQFKNILLDYFKYIEDEIFEGRDYTLPYKLGLLHIRKKKTKNIYKNFGLKDENGKIFRSLNEHSDGWVYNFRWSKYDTTLKNLPKYRLVMVRKIKRKLASLINNKLTDYPEL